MAGRVETTRLQFEVVINGEKKQLKNIKEVRQQWSILKNQIESGNLSVDEYNKKMSELQKLGAILNDHRRKMRGVNSAQEEASRGISIFGKRLLSFDTLLKATIIGALVGAALKLFEFGKAAFVASQEADAAMQQINRSTDQQV